jgi:hypothetical protein
MPDEPYRQITPDRKLMYYGGMICSGVGALLFLSTFVSACTNFGNFDNFHERTRDEFGRAIAGMILMMIGGVLMNIGRSGFAGSGVILDPEKTRKDLEPWNRTAGGMTQDALSEIEVVKKLEKYLDEPAVPAAAPPEPVVKIRCRACSALNDEHAKFCNQCAAPL